MVFRLTKLWGAIALMVALWGLSLVRDSGSEAWVRPVGTRPGPVRIIQFYASVGTLTAGQTAQLCYGVENARFVRIAPMISEVYPSANHCLQVGPKHTTHYTLLAEGYDGRVETRSFTLSVLSLPDVPRNTRYAGLPAHRQAQPQLGKPRQRGGQQRQAEEL